MPVKVMIITTIIEFCRFVEFVYISISALGFFPLHAPSACESLHRCTNFANFARGSMLVAKIESCYGELFPTKDYMTVVRDGGQRSSDYFISISLNPSECPISIVFNPWLRLCCFISSQANH